MENQTFWYALYSQSNKQIKVRDLLNRYSTIKAYIPCRTVERTHARKTELKEVPVIPTYVFFQCPLSDFSTVKNTPGVVRIMRKFLHTGDYVKIPDIQIQNIREVITKAPDTVRFKASDLPFRVGNKVQITDGPFKGHEGVIDRMKEEGYVQTVYLILEDLGYADLKVEAQYLTLV